MEKEKAAKPKKAKTLQAKVSQAKSSKSTTAKNNTLKMSSAKARTATSPSKTKVIKQKASITKTLNVTAKTVKTFKPTLKKLNIVDKTKATQPKLVVGSLELCNLPELGISDLQIRVDTGAKTSSLHVNNIARFKKNGEAWVSFDIHPDIYNVKKVVNRDCAIYDARKIKSSNGVVEERYVIKTLFSIGGRSWPIEITLSDRSDMSNLMLLGRQGMKSRILVDPSKKFLMRKLNK